jgi:3-deoxy-manno-octulosonate cytidylyltransferase (CMP-KDO synthetase)
MDSKRPFISGVIPVRMESRRLPGKPLRPICGRPMIAWVYERARCSPLLDRLTVATDSDVILAYCGEHGIPAVRTAAEHTSGTNRLIEVMNQEDAKGQLADIYVNIQGDEPMLTPRHLELLLTPFFGGTLAPNESLVSTLSVGIGHEAAADPNAVKVVTDLRGRALYFSRAPIPHDRDKAGSARHFKHLGFYAYTVHGLQRFQSLPPSPLEQTEQLEQLRFLEHGIPISVVETTEDTIGVDTEEDLKRVEQYFYRARTATR